MANSVDVRSYQKVLPGYFDGTHRVTLWPDG